MGVGSRWEQTGQLFEEVPVQLDAGFKVGHREILVRGVGLAIGKREAEHQGIRPKDVFEASDDGDAASFADQ